MHIEEGARSAPFRPSRAPFHLPCGAVVVCFRYKELVDPQVKSAVTRAFNTATHRSGAGVYHDPGAWPPTIL